MASLDVYRPAAQHQLALLGQQTDTAVLDIVAGEQPVPIAQRALDLARRQGFDVVILDTAGRLTVDERMMEAPRVKAAPIRRRRCWSPTRLPVKTRWRWPAPSTRRSALPASC